ncbi:YppG family protein [Halalkalibacter sp. APA_J-10(15)]|uniref:YppG family protein n=1 Tax=unclassified Halalkalibacter TaxID=2893063 RepID=UPI001FF38243|nr:YppG family protein [Halalkalibacter sp. APA_J-10(15)]MCK0471914.1 YppG family protein [Halalkalibacter sp. APA_J-10(15)]
MFHMKSPYYEQQPRPYHPVNHPFPQHMTNGRVPFQHRRQPFQQPYHQHIQHQPSSSPKKPSFVKSIFMNEEGKFDMNRTVQTVDQVVKTVNQVSPIIKQVSGLFLKK